MQDDLGRFSHLPLFVDGPVILAEHIAELHEGGLWGHVHPGDHTHITQGLTGEYNKSLVFLQFNWFTNNYVAEFHK